MPPETVRLIRDGGKGVLCVTETMWRQHACLGKHMTQVLLKPCVDANCGDNFLYLGKHTSVSEFVSV